jgi:hypothetical protein
MDVAGRFYVGTFYAFYEAWLRGNKTMSDSGYVMKDIEDLCKLRPGLMLQKANAIILDG